MSASEPSSEPSADRPGDAADDVPQPRPMLVDLDDFDAVGIVTEVLVSLRAHTMRIGADSAATVSAPPGWHRAVMTARDSGHVVLSVRYEELSTSRLKNVADALDRRGWQLDDDGEGSTIRFPPGTEASTPAFELLGALDPVRRPERHPRRDRHRRHRHPDRPPRPDLTGWPVDPSVQLVGTARTGHLPFRR